MYCNLVSSIISDWSIVTILYHYIAYALYECTVVKVTSDTKLHSLYCLVIQIPMQIFIYFMRECIHLYKE